MYYPCDHITIVTAFFFISHQSRNDRMIMLVPPGITQQTSGRLRAVTAFFWVIAALPQPRWMKTCERKQQKNVSGQKKGRGSRDQTMLVGMCLGKSSNGDLIGKLELYK